jgi:hypothetical protein
MEEKAPKPTALQWVALESRSYVNKPQLRTLYKNDPIAKQLL